MSNFFLKKFLTIFSNVDYLDLEPISYDINKPEEAIKHYIRFLRKYKKEIGIRKMNMFDQIKSIRTLQ
jgi:hypothetical protein